MRTNPKVNIDITATQGLILLLNNKIYPALGLITATVGFFRRFYFKRRRYFD